MRIPILSDIVTYVGEGLDRRFPWDRLPLPLGIWVTCGSLTGTALTIEVDGNQGRSAQQLLGVFDQP